MSIGKGGVLTKKLANSKPKIIRAVTAALSVDFFTGIIPELSEMGFEVISISSDGPELQNVIQAGGKVIIIDIERRIAPLKDLKSLFKIIKAFRREKPIMVHSMTPKAGLLCMVAAKLLRVPVRVHTFTGLVFPTSTGIKRKILMATDWLTCASATHIIPEGEGVKNDLINHRITRKPLKVLGFGNVRGIDLEKFNPQLEEVQQKVAEIRNQKYFTFIFIGRLVGDKGINELVKAFSELNEQYPNTRLLLVGSPEPELDPLKPETLEAINKNPKIEAVGPQKDVRPWLLASDAFVLPSYREGFPNVVIEAGAMGLPSVVSDINGSREIIIDGKNGIIIPPKDSSALKYAMEVFVTDKDLVKKLASNARGLIASRYEQSFVRHCLKAYYKEILEHEPVS